MFAYVLPARHTSVLYWPNITVANGAAWKCCWEETQPDWIIAEWQTCTSNRSTAKDCFVHMPMSVVQLHPRECMVSIHLGGDQSLLNLILVKHILWVVLGFYNRSKNGCLHTSFDLISSFPTYWLTVIVANGAVWKCCWSQQQPCRIWMQRRTRWWAEGSSDSCGSCLSVNITFSSGVQLTEHVVGFVAYWALLEVDFWKVPHMLTSFHFWNRNYIYKEGHWNQWS